MVHDGRTGHDDVVEDNHTSPVSLEHDGLLQTCSLSLSAVIPSVNGVNNERNKLTVEIRKIINIKKYEYTYIFTY